MATSREELEALGAREPFGGVMEQGAKSIETGKTYIETLVGFGFSQAKLAEMESLKSQVASSKGTRKSNAEASKGHTREQAAAAEAMRGHFFRINTVLPTVFRDNQVEAITEDSFAPTGRLNSPRRMLEHADHIRDLVLKLNEPLRPFFGGESPIEVHDRLRNALESANAKQEAGREALPKHTKDLNAAKGRLLELIDDLNRAGRVAFMDQPEIAACFNTEILSRARRGSKRTDEQPAGPTDPSQPD